MKGLLKSLGYDVLEDQNAQRVQEWKAWYAGFVQDFHSYTIYNGKKKLNQKRASLCMAKKVCEDWANLLMNEKVMFTVNGERETERMKEILDRNKFRVRANQLIELTFALGTGAFVEFVDEYGVNIDYITADKIFPISADNGQITECAFCSQKLIDGKKYYYLNIHVKAENGAGSYHIINRMFDENKRPCPLPEGIAEEFETGYDKPFFQVIKPNITSNIDIDSFMGISVYANCLDVFRAIDIVFDSYRNEFILGKKRVVVPVSLAEMVDIDGVVQPVFDTNDIAFYGIPDTGDDSSFIKELNMELRTQAHDDALRQNLNLLSQKCGFGPGHYDFERSGGLKTATEIISDKSDLFQNMKKHELILNDALTDLLCAVMYLDSGALNCDVNIDFDDSIIEDRKSEFAELTHLVSSGMMSKSEMRQWYFGETKEQADAAIAGITEDLYLEE